MTATGLMIIACAVHWLACWWVVRLFALAGGWPSVETLQPIIASGTWLSRISTALAGVSAISGIVAVVRCRGRFRIAALSAALAALVILGQSLASWMGWYPGMVVLRLMGVGGAL